MARNQNQATATNPLRPELERLVEGVSKKCTECRLCQKDCGYLKKYGTPKHIADSYDPADRRCQAMAFECSLCRLCAAVCPEGIDPGELSLEMRREAVDRGVGDYPEHASIKAYERRGTSKQFTYYALPEGCDTVFFPGCSLPGTRPDKVEKLYHLMREKIPALGIVLDCCAKPSHDLGREADFHALFNEMKDYLLQQGVRTVLVACPNCYKVFKRYSERFAVKTVYELISEKGLVVPAALSQTAIVHDPCGVRFEDAVYDAVRGIIAQKGVSLREMQHHRRSSLCCGEGGTVNAVSPELARQWGVLQKKEASGNTVITYCAGCAAMLGKIVRTGHVVDLLFEPEATLAGTIKVSKPPFTYVNRLRLKRKFKQTVNAGVTRERTVTIPPPPKKNMMPKLLLLLAVIAALILVRATGATRYLEQETLRNLIQGYGAIAPIIYMLIYAIAPALFLPGLPLTIAGGILFGPFWGVIYTITSSTVGACIAFLISRYLARDWVERKLRSPRWQKLDQDVERHGWKVVAFTRLIPAFPFNLLNYAFGLTKIKFLHYAVATFLFMLPACIAFIVFSSSLLDIFKGNISPVFVGGLLLIIAVSCIPLVYQRFKAKKDRE